MKKMMEAATAALVAALVGACGDVSPDVPLETGEAEQMVCVDPMGQPNQQLIPAPHNDCTEHVLFGPPPADSGCFTKWSNWHATRVAFACKPGSGGQPDNCDDCAALSTATRSSGGVSLDAYCNQGPSMGFAPCNSGTIPDYWVCKANCQRNTPSALAIGLCENGCARAYR